MDEEFARSWRQAEQMMSMMFRESQRFTFSGSRAGASSGNDIRVQQKANSSRTFLNRTRGSLQREGIVPVTPKSSGTAGGKEVSVKQQYCSLSHGPSSSSVSTTTTTSVSNPRALVRRSRGAGSMANRGMSRRVGVPKVRGNVNAGSAQARTHPASGKVMGTKQSSQRHSGPPKDCSRPSLDDLADHLQQSGWNPDIANTVMLMASELRCAPALASESEGESSEYKVVQGRVWDAVAELGDAKQALIEALVLPSMMPQYFQGIRAPWKGILLFGPPGCGKSLLARTAASETRGAAHFFACSPSMLLSKFHGDSEKVVKALFDAAHFMAPSVVVFDEIDAVMSQRGSEHEAMRRFKSELLMQMDGVVNVNTTSESENVTVMAMTNRPWDLDEAVLRRLERRIYVPLPSPAARRSILLAQFAHGKDDNGGPLPGGPDSEPVHTVRLHTDVNVDELVLLTENFSGADVVVLCRDAAMNPVRRAMAQSRGAPTQRADDSDFSHLTEALQQPVRMSDFTAALKHSKPSVSVNGIERFIQWNETFELGAKQPS